MTFKNQQTAYFGRVYTHPPMQISKKISGVTGPKFTPDVYQMNNIIYTPLCTIQQIYYIHNVVQMQLISYIHNTFY